MCHKPKSGYLFNRMQLPVEVYVLNGVTVIECRLFNPWWFSFHLICDEWKAGMVAGGWQSKNKGEIAPWPLQAVFNCNMPLNLHHHRVALHDSVNWLFPRVEWGLILHQHSSIVWWLLLVMSTKLKIFQHPHPQASLLWLWSKSGQVYRRTACRRHGTMLTELVWTGWLGRSLHRNDSIPFPVHHIQRYWGWCLVAQLCPTPLQPHGLWPARLLCPWDFLGKNTGVCCHFLLQGPFLTQGLNTQTHVSCIGRQILYGWATREAPKRYTRLTHSITGDVDFDHVFKVVSVRFLHGRFKCQLCN